MNILCELANNAKERVRTAKQIISEDELRTKALSFSIKDFPFEKTLKTDDISFICECKKASPSKGIISEDFPYLEIAKDYEAAGADCISVLTEPSKFLGNNDYLREIADTVTIPCLRKDFVVDEYMLYEAKILGAKAVLLICGILDNKQLASYIKTCDTLGISALVEAHNESEIKMAIKSGARMIGVNNRNLKDFSVDVDNSRRMRELVPKDILFISESGINSHDDIKKLRNIGADAVLIGETLMRASDKKAMLSELRGK